MKKILFITITFFISINAFCQNDYIPLIDTNRVWSIYYYPPGASFLYQLKDTTVVNDTVYHNFQVDITHPKSYKHGGGLLREDTSTKKVYIREGRGLSEYLLYDFGINIGDTVDYQKLGISKFVVDTIETYELLNGSERRKWTLHEIEGGWDQTVHWIEGIGSITQELFRPGGDDGSTLYSILLCCYENDELVYMNNAYDTCHIPYTNVEKLVEEKYAIFPNPASDKIFVKSDNIKQIKIYNIHGKLLHSGKIRKENYIDISHLPSGLILVRLFTYSNEVINYKIIKK